MVFAQLHLLYILLPLILLLLYVRWRRNKTYFAHPFLLYLQRRIRPASPLVRVPGLLEVAALGLLVVAVLDPTLPYGERLIQKRGLDIILVLDLSSSMQEPMDPRGAWERRRRGIIEKTRLEVPESPSLCRVPSAASASSIMTTTGPSERSTVRICSRLPSVSPTYLERKLRSFTQGMPMEPA